MAIKLRSYEIDYAYDLNNKPKPRNEPTKIEKKPRPIDIKEWNKQAAESNQRIIEKYKLVNK